MEVGRNSTVCEMGSNTFFMADFNGILVHSCMARDGHGNSITLLDKKGYR